MFTLSQYQFCWRLLICLVFSTIGLPQTLSAQTTTYIFMNASSVAADFSSPTVCRITGSFTVPQPLPPTDGLVNITPASFSFSNCAFTINDVNDIATFAIQTDADGNIVDYSIVLQAAAPSTLIVVPSPVGLGTPYNPETMAMDLDGEGSQSTDFAGVDILFGPQSIVSSANETGNSFWCWSQSNQSNCLPVITTNSLPEASSGQPYDILLDAVDGSGLYRWAASGLPVGFYISGSDLLCCSTGAPAAAPGTYRVTLTMTDLVAGPTSTTLPLVVAGCLPSTAAAPHLTITPSFNQDSSFTEAENTKICQAIAFYEQTFSNPINVSILFGKMNTGVGVNCTSDYIVSYGSFITALIAGRSSPNDVLALGRLPNSDDNPVSGSTTMSVTTPNIRALSINGDFPPFMVDIINGFCESTVAPNSFDGVIRLNTAITDVNGGMYSLLSVVEHEIDEVLGLGSTLPNNGPPSPEDLFRYAADPNALNAADPNNRSFSQNGCGFQNFGPTAYFSIDGSTPIEAFNNCNNGGDYGDWITNTPPQVQDAFASPSVAPLTVSSPEVLALDVIGYTLQVTTKKRRGQTTSQ